MPQLDPAGFVPQLFWLAVTFLVLYVLMRWVAAPQVGRAIAARRQQLDDDLAGAARLRAQAEEAQTAYQRTLATGRAEAQARLRQTTERMAAEAAERQRELAAALAAQIEAAERRIAASKEQALADIRDVATDLGAAMVEKLTGAPPPTGRMTAAVNEALAGRGA